MKRLKVRVLYEYGADLRPHGSGYLRLIRPLSHPILRDKFEVTFGRDLGNEKPDLVLLDRLWNPRNITTDNARKLVEEIHRKGAKLIYCFDDDFLGLEGGRKGIKTVHKECVNLFLHGSDGVIVTTEVLRNKYQSKQGKTIVLNNVLDERILVRKAVTLNHVQEKIVIGYMGTATHDEDLQMVLPALVKLSEENPNRFRIEVVGALENRNLRNWESLNKLEVTLIQPKSGESEYPLFMLWFTGMIKWDIAIAPLIDNPFNQSKSDIKFLDYSAAGVPGIYSDVPAYNSTLEDRKMGLLVNNQVEDWYSALSEFLKDRELRRKVSIKADTYLYENRILSVCGEMWVQAILGLV